MTTVATFLTPEDAHLFRAFLGLRGIEGFLLDEYITQLFWHLSARDFSMISDRETKLQLSSGLVNSRGFRSVSMGIDRVPTNKP